MQRHEHARRLRELNRVTSRRTAARNRQSQHAIGHAVHLDEFGGEPFELCGRIRKRDAQQFQTLLHPPKLETTWPGAR